MGVCVLRGLWSQPDLVRILKVILVFGLASVAGRILHHAPDGLFEHADPGDGARCATGPDHGSVFHDVHGNGAAWRIARWSDVGPAGRALDRCDWRFGLGVGSVVVQRTVAED